MTRSPTLPSCPSAALAALVLSLTACASQPPAVGEHLAVAQAAVQNANTASTSDTAAAELQIAIDKLAASRQALASKDYALADQLAAQSQVDARVAELHAQSERSRMAAKESQDASRALAEEIQRNARR